MNPRERMAVGADTRPRKTEDESLSGIRRAIDRSDSGEPIDTIDLYSTGLSHTMPFEGVPDDDIEFLGDFETVEQAAEFADCNGCGWYLWSKSCHGRYLGTICVMQGAKPEIREF